MKNHSTISVKQITLIAVLSFLICSYSFAFQQTTPTDSKKSTTYSTEPFCGSDKLTVSRFLEAIKNDDAAAVKSLLTKGAQINLCNEKGNTPLIWAVEGEKKKSFDLLISQGANPNQQNKRGESALSLAASKSTEVYWLKRILANGGDPNLVNSRSNRFIDMYPCTTPLFDAVEGGNVKCVQLLIEAGAEIDRKNGHGDTPLMIAAITNGRAEIAYCLIKAGANYNALDSTGTSIIERIKHTDESLIIDFFSTDKEQKRKNEERMREWHRKVLLLLKNKGALNDRSSTETQLEDNSSTVK